jgi:predicted RNA-binding Zn-ribbon protein involved in translation (DUF1610 family)
MRRQRHLDPVDEDDHVDLVSDEDGWDPDLDPLDAGDGTRFAREGSSLRAATRSNPRIYPCPTCGEPDRLTSADVARHYQCDDCATRAEGGGD